MSYSTGLNILEPKVINKERIQDLINSFSSIGASENGSVSRRGFSDEDIYARNFFINSVRELFPAAPCRQIYEYAANEFGSKRETGTKNTLQLHTG